MFCQWSPHSDALHWSKQPYSWVITYSPSRRQSVTVTGSVLLLPRNTDECHCHLNTVCEEKGCRIKGDPIFWRSKLLCGGGEKTWKIYKRKEGSMWQLSPGQTRVHINTWFRKSVYFFPTTLIQFTASRLKKGRLIQRSTTEEIHVVKPQQNDVIIYYI